MSTLNPEKMHVKFIGTSDPEGPTDPRRYTLTHSDTTGELFLSVGTEFDQDAISGLYTRLMRDEVLAELIETEDQIELHVYCHVSGGLVIGSASWRYAIFQRHMRQVLQTFRYGDDIFYETHPLFGNARVIAHFHFSNKRYSLKENWGFISDYILQENLTYATT